MPTPALLPFPGASQEPPWAPLTFCSPTQKRRKTSFMLPPFCMEMTRRWSSSFTHTRKVLLSLCLGGGKQRPQHPPPAGPQAQLALGTKGGAPKGIEAAPAAHHPTCQLFFGGGVRFRNWVRKVGAAGATFGPRERFAAEWAAQAGQEPLTRCPGRRASRGPCQRRAAGGRRACRRGNGHRSAAAAPRRSCSSVGSTCP